MSENGSGHDHDHDHDDDKEGCCGAEGVDLSELGAFSAEAGSRIFLEMRRQNLDLLKLAVEVAGYGGEHSPLKSGEMKHAIKGIWDVYSELYSWIDPEDASDGSDEEGEDEDQ